MQYKIKELPDCVASAGNFDESCKISISDFTYNSLTSGRLSIAIRQHGTKTVISNANVSVAAISGSIRIFIGDDDSEVTFEKETAGVFDLRLWRSSKVFIGELSTSNGLQVVCDKSSFISGRDCMFSDMVLVQTADQHGIIDLEVGEIINNNQRTVRIGDHVWLGRSSTVMPDTSIGDGAILGAGAIATKDIPPNSIAVGIPARVVSTSRTWSRSPTFIDDSAKKYISSLATTTNDAGRQ